MERALDPDGTCPSCGSWLEWSAVRYVPGRRTWRGMVEPRWEGVSPRCAVSTRPGAEPCPPLTPAEAPRPPVAVPVSSHAGAAPWPYVFEQAS